MIVDAILTRNAMGGAYVYGRRRTEAIRRRPGSRPTSTKVALGAWEVCLQAAHPGYIGWEAFMANQTRLSENVNRYAAARPGVPRRGRLALLQGIALCGRCGRRMGLRYSGPRGDYPVYGCRVDRDQSAGPLCQEVRAQPVDDLGDQQSVSDQVVVAISRHVSHGNSTLDQLARDIGIRPRSLQRTLSREGNSLRSLLQQQRMLLADKMLRNGGKSHAEIARALGYADATVFWRAFKTWTGTSPSRRSN